MIRRGFITPSFVVSISHTDDIIDHTIDCVEESLRVYKRALEEGVEKYLIGRSVKPVNRRYN
jgi:glutamate-1-semialdehyde 2,1-aminomutase